MTDWSELKAIMLPFPCLWDPQDPYFLDKMVKAACREQVFQIFNQRSAVPIDMESLKQWITDCLKNSTPTLQTATEELPITTSPQRGQSVQSKVAECTAQEITATEKLSITTSSQGGQSVPRNVAECTAQEIAVTEKPVNTTPQKCPSGKRKVCGYKARRVPTLYDLVKEYPCLWNRKDLNYRDVTMRSRCLQQLLQTFNKHSSTEITIADLRRKLIALQKRLFRADESFARGKSSPSSAGSLLAHLKINQKTVAPQGMPTLYDLIKEYPCLWNRKDLNYGDMSMRSRCLQQLLQEFNKHSSTEITIADLKRKLIALQQRLFRADESFARGKRLTSSAVSLLAHLKINQKTVAPQGMEAIRQTEVHEISEGYLGTNGEENEVQEITAENFRAPDNSQINPEASIDSTDTNQRPQDALDQGGRCLEVLFNYCTFCGELKISSDCNDIKHYAANNKCTLIINDLGAELEFTDDILPRNVCKDCDRKFQEMVDFVKCVKNTQVKFNSFNNEALDRRLENEDLIAENEKVDGQRKRCNITIDFNSDKLQPLSDNNYENNDIEMNNDYETGSFLVIDTDTEQRNESNVPINNNSPSLSLNNENTNSIKSHCHRTESDTSYITNKHHAEFLKNKAINDKIYVNTRRLSKTHHKTTNDFEDDVNSIVINIDDETAAKDINDKQKQLNADETCDDDRKIWKHQQLVIQRARKKAQLNNEM